MPTVSLPSVGTDGVTVESATPINANFATLQAAVNALDNNNIAGGAAIAYSKLTLTNSIVNADIATTAAISPSKLAGYPTNATLYLDGTGAWSAPAGTLGQKVNYVGTTTLNSAASNTFETANAAILIPFTIQVAQSITTISFAMGNTKSGNYDVGVYNAAGTRQVSKGSTAQSTLTVSTVNNITVATTALPAGQYYLALAADNATGAFLSGTAAADGLLLQQCRKVTTSFPLPGTITPGAAAPTSNYLLTGTLT